LAETHETVHRESGMRYQLPTTSGSSCFSLPARCCGCHPIENVIGALTARHVPVPETFVVVVQGEVGVDAKRQGVVGGQSRELVEALGLTHAR
jgi:hypothetical protein